MKEIIKYLKKLNSVFIVQLFTTNLSILIQTAGSIIVKSILLLVLIQYNVFTSVFIIFILFLILLFQELLNIIVLLRLRRQEKNIFNNWRILSTNFVHFFDLEKEFTINLFNDMVNSHHKKTYLKLLYEYKIRHEQFQKKINEMEIDIGMRVEKQIEAPEQQENENQNTNSEKLNTDAKNNTDPRPESQRKDN